MSDLDDVLYVPLFPSQNSLHSALDQAKKSLSNSYMYTRQRVKNTQFNRNSKLEINLLQKKKLKSVPGVKYVWFSKGSGVFGGKKSQPRIKGFTVYPILGEVF